ncbi:hypothetical protein GCM10007108_15970 [Thermogymnomonas acidicola]|uniref:DUF302 domain-containing protein n=1 Tax=Thermogymnomonas acidicola TaxID=399579 RepID=A0AA37BTH9_9ARCH|nr:DUF302 domain-containing protein [Thermogymnomonas acidicola]GGM78607.1 hypothetical protein GCM10007108_15970 [Thermogymnomonas acidicola]
MQHYIEFVSTYGFQETLERLRGAVRKRSLTIFCEVDHRKNAESVGLSMGNATVVSFGDPRAGTPLMVENPRVALELPLKILVYEKEGKTAVGFRNPEWLSQDLSNVEALSRMKSLLTSLSLEASGSRLDA